jgi:tetratricopeptide (TPR) repeat protein
MAEDGHSGADRQDEPAPDGTAIGIAMNEAAHDNSVAIEARVFLREQTAVLRLQKEVLEEERRFNLSHLHHRRFSDFSKSALEIAVGLLILLIVCGLGTMVWNAVEDHDLVVDAFSVPPDVAQTGLTGSVLAARVLDRFAEMDSNPLTFAEGVSAFRVNNREEARVEIPETGISIGEFDHYLHGWLGHATHVTGELLRNGKGLSLTVRYGDQPGLTASGAPDQLDGLIQKAAENIFRAVRPLRFADYLSSRGRFAEAESIARGETYTGSDKYRSLAYVSLSVVDFFRADESAIRRDGELAVALDPGNLLAWYTLQSAWGDIGHDEDEWRTVNAAAAAEKSGETLVRDSETVRNLPAQFAADASALTGAYKDALVACTSIVGRRLGACNGGGLISANAALHNTAEARLLAGLHPRLVPNGSVDVQLIFVWAEVEADAGHWEEALAWSKKGEAASSSDPTKSSADRDVSLRPFETMALAGSGDIAGAAALIAKTPLDCDVCVRTRGKVATVGRDWSVAAHWFSLVAARSPDIPFADADWGAMLLAKGDYGGAIAKFESAHRIGPHFADPLEMWGEALMLENRSDLAVPKFEEANKYAPNWGRLHLKWGEALLYAGRKDDARVQFQAAAAMDMSVADRAALARDMKAFHV